MKQKNVLYTGLDPTHYLSEGTLTHLPLIQIIPYPPSELNITSTLEAFRHYTHIIITSKSTIKILLNYLPLFGYHLKDWKEKTTISVGNVTAHHLHKINICPLIIAQEETAEGIIKELDRLDLKNCFFLWLHSEQARPVLIHFFKNRAIPFSHASLYKTETIKFAFVPDLDPFDEIVFTSPSTIKAFLTIFGKIPENKILTCIGPITQNFLNQHSD